MEKTISKIDQVRALMPENSKFELKTVSTSTGEQYCFETGDWGNNVFRLIGKINESLAPYFILIKDVFDWRDEDRRSISYYFDIVTISDLQLPIFLTSETGYMTLMIPSFINWESIRILETNSSIEIGQVPAFSAEKLIRRGDLMLTTEMVFKDRFCKALKRFSDHVNKVVPHEAA